MVHVLFNPYVFVFFSFLFGFSLLSIFFAYSRGKRMRFNLLSDVFAASDFGQVLFSSNGSVSIVNDRAAHILSSLIEGDVFMMTQSQLLDNLYDCAADFDESIRNMLIDMGDEHSEQYFKEVISFSEGDLFLVTGRPVNDDYTLFTFVNISLERKRESNLIQLDLINRHLFQAMQAATSGIIISDPIEDSHPVIFANNAFYEFANCDEDDLKSQHWQIFNPLFVDDYEKEKFEQAFSDFSEVDLSLTNQVLGKQKYYDLKLTPVFDEKGDLDLYVGIVTDVTLLKQRESEYFHAQKLDSLGQLAAGVAHDFNNILSIISGYSMMISKQAGEHDAILGFSEKISVASERGAGLTRKMLTFSRHQVVAQDVFNLCEIVHEQSDLLAPLLVGAIDMQLSLGDEPFNVRGDTNSLRQVLMNLAINARDAMLGGGVLNIGVDAPDITDIPEKIHKRVQAEHYVRLFVKDSGTGMDAETLSKVFDPFFSTKEKDKGTGLGLSIVHGLVNEMRGAVDVQSSLDEGTIFSVYLPRSLAEKTKVLKGGLQDLSSIRLDGFKALVVEDEADILDVVTRMLEDVGVDVIGASNGTDGLVACDENEGQFDIVLTDVIMPQMNGVKMSELIHALYPDMNIVFMSGYPAQGDMTPVDIPEGYPFIAKPVDYEALIPIVFRVLNNDHSGDHALSHWQSSTSKPPDEEKGVPRHERQET